MSIASRFLRTAKLARQVQLARMALIPLPQDVQVLQVHPVVTAEMGFQVLLEFLLIARSLMQQEASLSD